MESDPNVFLSISAYDTLAHQAISLSHNNNRYVPADEETPQCSRETTPEPGESSPWGDHSSGQLGGCLPARLQLRFDQPPDDVRSGFIFGSDPKQCDILVGRRASGVSAQHFALNFDDKSRLVLRNLSKRGMSVSYDGHGSEERRNRFEWLLLPGWRIRVHVATPDDCVFLLELPKGSANDVQYATLLRSYVSQVHRNHSQLSGMPSSSEKDLRTSKAGEDTGEASVYADKALLGEGAFGTVYKSINVSTGKWVAVKRFDWDSKYADEIRIMREISHNHIVQCFDSIEGSRPGLVMEYLPLGCLEQHSISNKERCILLYQMLSAVSHIHGSGLAHRDIKTANILVKATGDNFWAKLSDFGFAKSDKFLSTLCGSSKFLAPEIWMAARDPKPYTNAVDIWSLGVVMLDVSDNLPWLRGRKSTDAEKRRDAPGGYRYCELVAHRATELLRDHPNDPISLVVSRMLVMEDLERLNGSGCLQLYLQNAPEDDFITPATTRTNTGLELKPAVSRASTNLSRMVYEACNELHKDGLIDHDINASELLGATASAKHDVSLDQILEDCQRSPPSESRKRKRSTEPDTPRKSRCKNTSHSTSCSYSKFGIQPALGQQPEITENGIRVALSDMITFLSTSNVWSNLICDENVRFPCADTFADQEKSLRSSHAVLLLGSDVEGVWSLDPLIHFVQVLGIDEFHTHWYPGRTELHFHCRTLKVDGACRLEEFGSRTPANIVQALVRELEKHSRSLEAANGGPKRNRETAEDADDEITSKRRRKTGLSTRSFEKSEIQQCTIKGKTVHFQLHDRMICLDDLAKAAKRKPGWAQRKLDGIPTESKEASPHGTLVAFDVALPIVRALNMKKIVCRETGMDEMRPPAAYQGNLYTYISVLGKRVCLREQDGRVNAAHLVRAAGKHRTSRNRTLEACGISATDIEQIPGHPTAQGGYVSYAHGRKMCEFLGLEVPEAMLEAEGPEVAGDEESVYVSYSSGHRPKVQELYPNPFRRSLALRPGSPEPEGILYAGENDGEQQHETSFPDSTSSSRVSHWESSTRSHLSAVQPNYSIGSIGHPGWPSGASSSSLFGLSRASSGSFFLGRAGQDVPAS